MRILEAPVNLGDLAGRFRENDEEQASVFMVKKDLSNMVGFLCQYHIDI